VVLLFPNGVAGMYQSRAKDVLRLLKREPSRAPGPLRETPSQVGLTPVGEVGKHV